MRLQRQGAQEQEKRVKDFLVSWPASPFCVRSKDNAISPGSKIALTKS
jgi:hypothetical protein